MESKENSIDIIVLQVVKVLDIGIFIVEGKGGLYKLSKRESKIYLNNNLLRYSKGEEISCCLKRKEAKAKIVERKDSLYRVSSLDYRSRLTGIELYYYCYIRLYEDC